MSATVAETHRFDAGPMKSWPRRGFHLAGRQISRGLFHGLSNLLHRKSPPPATPPSPRTRPKPCPDPTQPKAIGCSARSPDFLPSSEGVAVVVWVRGGVDTYGCSGSLVTREPGVGGATSRTAGESRARTRHGCDRSRSGGARNQTGPAFHPGITPREGGLRIRPPSKVPHSCLVAALLPSCRGL